MIALRESSDRAALPLMSCHPERAGVLRENCHSERSEESAFPILLPHRRLKRIPAVRQILSRHIKQDADAMGPAGQAVLSALTFQKQIPRYARNDNSWVGLGLAQDDRGKRR